MQPELHIVAGPNGIGKTTAFDSVIPEGIDYINADLIAKDIKAQARGLNTQDIANGEASKLFFGKASKRESFAIETNLYDLATYKSFQGLQAIGYHIAIYFLSADDVDVCIDRVKLRSAQGGHYVNPSVIKERYTSGLALLKHFKDFPDVLMLLDNSTGVISRQIILRRGVLTYKADICNPWVEHIIEETKVPERPSEKTTIDEVRSSYKRGLNPE